MSAPTEVPGLESNWDRGPGERHDIRPHGTETRTYVTEIWCPPVDDGIQRLHSPVPGPEPFTGPETAREWVNGLMAAALACEAAAEASELEPEVEI